MSNDTPWFTLKAKYSWPTSRPTIPLELKGKHRGWLSHGTQVMLAAHHQSDILELGSWTGLSARFMLDAESSCRIICVDHFEGSRELMGEQYQDVLPILEDVFRHRCWDYRERIVLIQAKTLDAIEIVRAAGFRPGLIYVDASHEYDDVRADIKAATDCFPAAVLVGDDWRRDSVRDAVIRCCEDWDLQSSHNSHAWMICPKGKP